MGALILVAPGIEISGKSLKNWLILFYAVNSVHLLCADQIK